MVLVVACVPTLVRSMIWMYTASLATMHNAASLASVAEDMACLIMCAIFSTAQLLCGTEDSIDKKK